MSKERRILGSDKILSTVKDPPKEEQAQLYEARQKIRTSTRACAPTPCQGWMSSGIFRASFVVYAPLCGCRHRQTP